jgi:hypothetical protein
VWHRKEFATKELFNDVMIVVGGEISNCDANFIFVPFVCVTESLH